MTSDDFEKSESPAVVEGLDRLAARLDAERYPGKAWSAAGVGSRRHWRWGVAAGLIGFAAGVCVVAGLWRMRHGAEVPVAPAPQVAVKPTRAEATPPLILVFQDRDSYSVVDLTGDVPVVSYATRHSQRFEFTAPVLPSPASEPTTTESPL